MNQVNPLFTMVVICVDYSVVTLIIARAELKRSNAKGTHLTRSNKKVEIWLGLAIAFMAIVAVEIAGLTIKGFHTISYTAQKNKLVFWLIFLAGIVFLGFWVDHIFFSGAIPR